MPIIGLTHQLPAFPRIGELRKGDVKSTNRPGKNLTHFRFTSKDSDALTTFNAAYGNEPRHVNCYLPYPTTDENFEAWIEEWGAGSLKWRGDGQNLVLWQTPQGTYSTQPKAQPNGGKQIGRLKMIVPELQRMAYVTALTTSINDIMELHANLSAYEALRGSLVGIPFILSRIPREISTPGKDGKRLRREEWLLHIEAQPAWVQAQLGVMRQNNLPTPQRMVALDTGEIVDMEFEEEPLQLTVATNAPKRILPSEVSTTGLDDHSRHISLGSPAPAQHWTETPPASPAAARDTIMANVPRYSENSHAAVNVVKKFLDGKEYADLSQAERVKLLKAVETHAAERDKQDAADAVSVETPLSRLIAADAVSAE